MEKLNITIEFIREVLLILLISSWVWLTLDKIDGNSYKDIAHSAIDKLRECVDYQKGK